MLSAEELVLHGPRNPRSKRRKSSRKKVEDQPPACNLVEVIADIS